jgi:hypothetical protein
MSQITTYSLEPGMGLDKLKKDDIKKLLDQRDLNYDEKNNWSDLVVLLRMNIEFEADNKIEGNKIYFSKHLKTWLIICFYYLEAKKRMDLDVIMDDKDDIDNLKTRKKKKNLSIIEEQFDNAE